MPLMTREQYMKAALSVALKQARKDFAASIRNMSPVDVTVGYIAGAIRVRIDWSDEIVLTDQTTPNQPLPPHTTKP